MVMPAPRVSLLDLDDRDFIHERTLEVLDTVGVRFRSAAALQVLKEAGCRVDLENEIARIPAQLVEWALGQLPRDILLAGRDPGRDALLDGSRTFATVAGICPYVVDMDTGLYRAPRLRDVEDLTRIADALDAFGIVWYSVSPTGDTQPRMTDLAATACMLAATSKHVMGQVTRPAEVPYAVEIVRLCAADGGSEERPLFSIIYCPVAPLQHCGPAIEAAMALAARRVPIDIFSLGLAGATAPVTLAGTITQTNCEVLSATVLFQLVAPGCPLIYSANAGIMDMRTSRFAVSTPETILMNVAQIELAHSYGMPALSVGFVPDASELGFRCGVEDMGFALPTRLARPDIMTGLGTLEAGQAVSYPKMVLDAEIVAYLDRLMGGIAVDGEHISVDAISSAGAGGHYLSQRETRTRIRSGEHWLPDLFHRHSYSERRGGAPDEVHRAAERVAEILAEHGPLPLPPGAPERVADVLVTAERELPED
jgi:trimethylamine--corrinoid protein Co-methyltransferase